MTDPPAVAEAQHVIMMEPIFDPAVEQQAIGRIHRIGQAGLFISALHLTTALNDSEMSQIPQREALPCP